MGVPRVEYQDVEGQTFIESVAVPAVRQAQPGGTRTETVMGPDLEPVIMQAAAPVQQVPVQTVAAPTTVMAAPTTMMPAPTTSYVQPTTAMPAPTTMMPAPTTMMAPPTTVIPGGSVSVAPATIM